MIAVIADDLTGAAEIAGIALRNGFRVVMDTKVQDSADTDVLVIATDTRSQSIEDAKMTISEVTEKLLALQPQLIFKKADSLLRGHIGEELDVQMAVSGKKRTLLIPANPSLKRTIREGIYYADGVPLNESQLADAYRKRITTSKVTDLIGQRFKGTINIISTTENLPANGLIIGNTISEADLDAWAEKIDTNTIPAGSSGFFNAILKNRKQKNRQKFNDKFCLGKQVLYVCGSAFLVSKAYVRAARINGKAVSYMPSNIFCDDNLQEGIDAWFDEITGLMLKNGSVIIAVDRLHCKDAPELPFRIRTVVATVIERIMQLTILDELVIEGGATASAIIEKLDYQRFFPTNELAQGVIRMKVQENEGLYITMKPGSYQWPESIWDQKISCDNATIANSK